MRQQSKIRRLGKILGLANKVVIAKTFGREMPKAELLEGVLELGGVYVKFLQILAVRNINILQFGQDSIETINKVYDQVEVEDIDIGTLISSELGNRSQQFAFVETRPFASGSFGQVYHAELKDGQKLAVKVIRPSVVNNINFDLNLLGLIVRLGSISNKSAYDVKKIFHQFATVTRKEIDYVAEAEYAQLLYNKYLVHPYLVIPKTYTDLSGKHIITQDLIEGVSATELITLKQKGLDPNQYVAEQLNSDLNSQLITIGQEQLASMLRDGYSHGDPHPGNIILMRDNRVAMLDFGIKARVPADRKAFFDLVREYQKIYAGQFDFEGYTLAMMNLFVSELSDAVRAFDVYTRGAASENLLGAIKSAVGDIYQGSQRDVADLLDKQRHLLIFSSVINNGNRFGLKFETEEPEFLRATIIYMNLVESLGHKQEIMNVVYTNVVNRFATFDFQTGKHDTTPVRAVEVVSSWLDDVASRDVYLFNMLVSKIGKRFIGV